MATAAAPSVLSVADVLAIPVLRGAGPQVLAGAEALGTRVRWVHSAELADIAPLLREGDLLLSTGIAMPNSPAELARFAASLAETRASGLVIELGRRWQRLPRSLVQACDDLGLPLVALAREVRFAAVIQAVGEMLVASRLAELDEAHHVHETFTALSMEEAGPDRILAAAQRLAGSTVVRESEEHRVLDYRAGPGDVAELLAAWTGLSRDVRDEGRTMWDGRGWLVTRVGRRDRRWGRLVVHAPDPPTAGTVAVIERAAAALAMHRLQDRQRDSLVRRTHHELLVGLLADPTSPDLLRRCEVAGVPTERRSFVGVTLRPRVGPGSGGGRAALVDEVIAATAHAAHELGAPALVGEIDTDVRVLLSLAATHDTELVGGTDRVVDRLAARVARRHAVVVGAGRPVTRSVEIDRTLREAHQVVQSLRGEPVPGRVHRLDDVHLRGLLSMLLDDERLRLFVDRELSALREYDERHGTALLDAVRALLTHPQGKSAAAASLHLSRPVFYDRVARAQRVLRLDLDDPDIRASLHVALLAAELTASLDTDSR